MFELIKTGKRSKVYAGKYKGKKAILKRELGNSKREGKWLIVLNKYGIGPKLYAVKKNSVIIEFVKGKSLLELTEKGKVKKEWLIEVLRQCRVMDKLKINKREFTRPYQHVLINKEVKMIDFERCYKSKKVRNVTQFCQFLMKFKKKLGLKLDDEEFIKLLRNYKRKPNEKNFKKLKKNIPVRTNHFICDKLN